MCRKNRDTLPLKRERSLYEPSSPPSPALVEVVEGSPELVELLLGDALAVPGQDLVLNLVDGSEKP